MRGNSARASVSELKSGETYFRIKAKARPQLDAGGRHYRLVDTTTTVGVDVNGEAMEARVMVKIWIPLKRSKRVKAIKEEFNRRLNSRSPILFYA